jgi:hypothetical protein
VTEILKTGQSKVIGDAENLADYLGVPRFRYGEAESSTIRSAWSPGLPGPKSAASC